MNKKLYYTLNCTWGILMTLIGLLCASVLSATKHTAYNYRGCLHYKVGKNWGGVSLGLVIITDVTPSDHTLKHEYGHTLQNALYGILFPFIVAIPSAMRYHERIILAKKGAELEPYDAVWYEGQATEWGNKY